MSSIKRRPDGMWRARYRDLDGKEHAKHFERKTDADKWVTTQMASVLRGEHVDPHDKTTVADYAREWAKTRPHKHASARRVKSQIEVHIAGTSLGNRRMAAVRPSEVQAWVTGRAAVVAPSTLRGLVTTLRSIYAAAILDRVVGYSPATQLTLPASTKARLVPLTVQQVRDLAEAMPAVNKAMVLTQAGLGLRIGELLALRVQDIDFLRRTARVEHQIASHQRIRTDPKTPLSRRTLPLPKMVANALAEHIRKHPPAEDGTIFTNAKQNNRPWSDGWYGTTLFKAAVVKAKLPEGTTSHDLRHHYASVLLAAGESVVAVAERLGHENAKLVLTTYGHLMPDSEDRTRKAVDDAWTADEVDDAADQLRTSDSAQSG